MSSRKKYIYEIAVIVLLIIGISVMVKTLVEYRNVFDSVSAKARLMQQRLNDIEAVASERRMIESYLPKKMSLSDRISAVEGIYQAHKQYGVKAEVILTFIEVESAFESEAVSNKGAVGLMQVLPIAEQDVRDAGLVKLGAPRDGLKDPYYNIQVGTAYIRRLYDYFSKSYKDESLWIKIVVSYNEGMTSGDKKTISQLLKNEYFEKIDSKVQRRVN